MRVLVIDKTAGLKTSQERYIQLAQQGDIDLHVMAPKKWLEHGLIVNAQELEPPQGYTLHLGTALWKGYYARGFYLTGLIRALRRSKPEIIHLLEEPWSFFAWQAIRTAGLLGLRRKWIFYTWENIYRDFSYPSRISWIQKRIDRLLHHRCLAAMCASEQARTVLELKKFHGPIKVIPYGVDTPFLEDNIIPALPQAKDSPFRVGYVGRFMKMKGLDILIEAVARVKDVNLLLIGAGEYEEAMRSLIERKEISHRVQILSPIPRENVPSFLASMDVFVLPSRTTEGWMEQLGRSAIEAMAVGVPVIGSNSGSIPEVLEDAGMLYQEDTAGGLAQCIEKLKNNSELREEMIRRGKQRIKERFNWNRFAEESYQLYEQVMTF